jgi:hypothetical protein
MTQPCGELRPDDIMIVADLGKNANGIQRISTVGKTLSIRQSREVTAANATFIVRAVNAHDDLVWALKEARESLCILDHNGGRDSGLSVMRNGKYIRDIIKDALAKAEQS